jgi:L,D-transpeptidase ErfK/SrfK
MARTLPVLLLLAALAVGDPPQRVTGSVWVHHVGTAETLGAVGARFGVEPKTLARDNHLPPDVKLRTGDRLTIDNRHVVPPGPVRGLLLNVPQRMLFVFEQDTVVAGFPVAVGRPDWATPLGTFAVAMKEVDPTWDVPESIQREMVREGRPLRTRVPPGPDNPLGTRWIGLTAPNVGIHGTNQPSSIYRFTTHGCIRLHPDDAVALYELVTVGMPVHIVYEPVLVARTEDDVLLLEVHRDPYRKADAPAARARQLLRAAGAGHLAESAVVQRALAEKAGRAVVIAPN